MAAPKAPEHSADTSRADGLSAASRPTRHPAAKRSAVAQMSAASDGGVHVCAQQPAPEQDAQGQERGAHQLPAGAEVTTQLAGCQLRGVDDPLAHHVREALRGPVDERG